MDKQRGILRQIVDLINTPIRLRKLEKRLLQLEQEHRDHVVRFSATIEHYERRLDVLTNLYAKRLSSDEPGD